jgi:hypothetical protein
MKIPPYGQWHCLDRTLGFSSIAFTQGFSSITFTQGFSSIAFQKDFPPSSVAISMIFQSPGRLVGRPHDRKDIEIPRKYRYDFITGHHENPPVRSTALP